MLIILSRNISVGFFVRSLAISLFVSIMINELMLIILSRNIVVVSLRSLARPSLFVNDINHNNSTLVLTSCSRDSGAWKANNEEEEQEKERRRKMMNMMGRRMKKRTMKKEQRLILQWVN